MAEPKKRLTSSRSGKRRSHLGLKAQNLAFCSHCHQATLPHRICPNCGYYKGVDVLKLEEKLKAKEERRKKREEELKEEKSE